MLCRNCGNSIVDAARFCSFCGVQQPVAPSAGDTSAGPPMPDSSFEGSDVTVILPGRRADARAAPAAHPDEEASFVASTKDVSGESATSRSGVPAMKVVGAAALAIIATFAAVAFYASRVAPPAGEAGAPSAAAVEPTSASVSSAILSHESNSASPTPDTPSAIGIEAATAVNEAPTTEASSAPDATSQVPAHDAKEASTAEAPRAPEAMAQVPTHRTVAPAKNAAQRKKGRAPATPVPEPAPMESQAPQPVAIAPPASGPVTIAPPVEPPKAESVACADTPNPFSRELCLWQECAKPEYRSHAECARFTGPSGRRN
jgi:hypothetical protein